MSFIDEVNSFYKSYCNADPWDIAPFSSIKKMENDTRGQFGEKIISEAFHLDSKNTFDMDYGNGNHHEDGIYDLKINNKRIEVKTSCHTKSFTWQHEPLYEKDVYDYVIFIDFTYDCFYISYVSREELPLSINGAKKVPTLFGTKKGTLRKEKMDGYKLDFSRKTISLLNQAGRCKVFNDLSTLEDIKNFISGVFNI